MAAGKRTVSCDKCGSSTYTSNWGDSPQVKVTYCAGCNEVPRNCTCLGSGSYGPQA